MDITITLIYQPIFNLIVVLYRLFSENLGLAIVVVAILSRLITIPLMIRQKRTMVKSREMNEKVKAIKEKHKNNKEAHDKELMALQSEYLPGQIAGCLPLILQLIVFINIYNVISNLVVKGGEAFNSLAYPFVAQFPQGYALNYSFLGFDLSKHPFDFANAGVSFIPYIALMVLIGLSQYVSMKVTMNMSQAPKDKQKEKDQKKDPSKPEDFGSIVQQSTQQTMLLFPILYIFISYNFPAGLSIYWIVQNGFVIIQQFLINKYFSNKDLVKNGDVSTPDAIIGK